MAGTGGAGANVAHALSAAGVNTEVVSPGQVPATVSGVARWQTVVLVDVSAAELGLPAHAGPGHGDQGPRGRLGRVRRH